MKIMIKLNNLTKGFFSGLSFFALLSMSNNVEAQTGSALNFDGLNDYVNLGTPITTSLVNSNVLTVEAWVRPTSLSGVANIVSNHENGATQFALRRDNGQFQFFLGFGVYNIYCAASPTINTWQHLAAVFNGNSIRFYLNGVATNSVSTPAYSLVNSAAPVRIGTNWYNEAWSGDIDGVRIWKRALCQSEIQNNMLGELPGGVHIGLLANYNFNQGTAGGNNTGVATLTDASPNLVNGTLTNFALNGATSNWVTPGGVSNGSLAPVFFGGSVTVNSGSINPGQTFTINPAGGTNYSYVPVGPTVSPNVIATYTVYGTAGGCLNKAVSTVTVNANCLNFDGINDRVDLGTAITNSFVGKNKVTLEAWVKPSTTSGYGAVVGNYETPATAMQFLLRRDVNTWTFWVGNSVTNIWTGAGSPAATASANVWQHLAGTYNGTVLSLYINGVLSATNSASYTFAPLASSVVIGANSTAMFSGDIDEVRIWDRALCQGEIQNNMNGELNLPQTSLVSYYKFNQGISGGTNTLITTATDLGAANVSGTLTNMNLTGNTSNWMAPGAIAIGSMAPTYTLAGFAVAGPSTLCAGSPVTFTASGLNSYSWSTGAATSTVVVSPTVNSSYNVVGTATNGCQATLIKSVTVSPVPSVSVASSGTAICVGETATLTASGASTYSWNTGAGNASVAVSPTTTTAYTVVGTNTIGCSNTATFNLIVNICTSLNQLGNEINDTKLYPNPTSGSFILELASASQVKVLDITGRSVYSTNLVMGNYKIDLSAFENGIYFVQIIQNERSRTIKVVKE